MQKGLAAPYSPTINHVILSKNKLLTFSVWLILSSLIYKTLPAQIQSQKILAKAELYIETGKHRQATALLSELAKGTPDSPNGLMAKIMAARILHENGQRLDAITMLRTVLAQPKIIQPPLARIRTEAYLWLAECYFGMNWIERFKEINDTAFQLIGKYRLTPDYKTRALTNMVRYYNFHILGYRTQPYLDSALALLNSAPANDRHKYKPVALLTAYLTHTRNQGNIKIKIMDSVAVLMQKLFKGELYNQVHLLRALGNSAFDYARMPLDKKSNISWRSKSTVNFLRAKKILEEVYPANQIDHIMLNNLLGLQEYYCGFYRDAKQYFDSSESIIAKQQLSTTNFAYLYLNTYTYKLNTIDSLYKGNALKKKQEEMLKQWEAFAPSWEAWEVEQQNKRLQTYRNVYATGPYGIIVDLCYKLYQFDHNQDYINRAFHAQETGKAHFLKAKLQKTRGLEIPKPPHISTIQKSLEREEIILSLSNSFSYFKESHSILISKDTVIFLTVAADSLFFSSFGNISNADSICKNASTFSTAFSRAYMHFFQPLEPFITKDVKRIHVFSSAFTSRFNFGLMVKNQSENPSFEKLSFLFRQFDFQYDYSWQTWAMTHQRTPQKNFERNNYLAFVPDYTNTILPRLPYFEKSAHTLQKHFGFQTFEHGQATLQNFEAKAGAAGIIQIAGHLKMNVYQYAEDVYIILDSAANKDFRLNAINLTSIKLESDLVVLALCESGLGDNSVSEHYINMAYWFLSAGAKSCLYSLWKLDEKAGVYIIEKFYHYLSQGLRKSEALRKSQEDYLAQTQTEEERNPKYWAGLMLIGDDSPIQLKVSKGFPYGWLALLLVPALFIFYNRKSKHLS